MSRNHPFAASAPPKQGGRRKGDALDDDTLETDPNKFYPDSGKLFTIKDPAADAEPSYDPAGAEVVKGERQWKIRYQEPREMSQHTRIVGVNYNGLRIYDKAGQHLLKEFLHRQVSGYRADSGQHSVLFAWAAPGKSSPDTYGIYSKAYYREIHEEITRNIALNLQARNVADVNKVMQESGITEVTRTTNADLLKKTVKNVVKVDDINKMYPTDSYFMSPRSQGGSSASDGESDLPAGDEAVAKALTSPRSKSGADLSKSTPARKPQTAASPRAKVSSPRASPPSSSKSASPPTSSRKGKKDLVELEFDD